MNSSKNYQENLRKNSVILAVGQQIVKQENSSQNENNLTLVLSPTHEFGQGKKN